MYFIKRPCADHWHLNWIVWSCYLYSYFFYYCSSEWVLIPHEKVLMRHELIIIVTRRSKLFSWSLRWWIDVLRVQSRENHSENLTRFSGGFKTENFKKLKNEVSWVFFLDFTSKTYPTQYKVWKQLFEASWLV